MNSVPIVKLLLEVIVCRPQVRLTIKSEAIAALASTLMLVGQLYPILVRKNGDKFDILDGERRYLAARHLGWKSIDAIVCDKDLSEGEIIQKQLLSNGQREGLTPVELAKAIARLIDVTGWKIGQAAQQLGMSPATVSKLLGLLKLPEALREKVASGAIPASAGYELSRINDPEAQQALAEELIAGQLTRDSLVTAIRQRARQAKETHEKPVNRVTAQLGRGRSVTVAGESLSLESFIEILEELLVRAKRVRPRGILLPTFVKMIKDEANS